MDFLFEVFRGTLYLICVASIAFIALFVINQGLSAIYWLTHSSERDARREYIQRIKQYPRKKFFK